jgi:hypothetical protein
VVWGGWLCSAAAAAVDFVLHPPQWLSSWGRHLYWGGFGFLEASSQIAAFLDGVAGFEPCV